MEPFEAPVGDEPEDFEDFLTNYVQQISFVNGAPVGDEPEDFEAPVGEAQKTPEDTRDFDESYLKTGGMLGSNTLLISMSV